MRIAFVGTLPPHPGGSAIHSIGLLNGLAQRGHEISAIAPITAESAEVLGGAPFRVTRYLVPHYENAPGRPSADEFRAVEGRGVAAHLTPLLESARPDLILAGRETFAWHVGDPARRYDLPWVLISHGGVIWGLLDGSYPPELVRALLAEMRRADRVVTVARHQGERLRALGIEKVATVPNAVDPQVFAPAARDPELMRELGVGAADVVVAHISNLKDVKRPLETIRVAAQALRRDPRLLCVIVGDGPNRSSMVAECERLGVRDRFRFTGWVPYQEMPRYVNLADVVIMPSENEAMAFAYLETMACGRVLIASDVAGAREIVEDGVNGILFDTNDLSALVEAVLRAAADPPLRAAIGERARAFVTTRPLARAIDEFEALFATVIRERRG
jgi:glycosyltransferase involved in cell wall biosynthesis